MHFESLRAAHPENRVQNKSMKVVFDESVHQQFDIICLLKQPLIPNLFRSF